MRKIPCILSVFFFSTFFFPLFYYSVPTGVYSEIFEPFYMFDKTELADFTKVSDLLLAFRLLVFFELFSGILMLLMFSVRQFFMIKFTLLLNIMELFFSGIINDQLRPDITNWINTKELSAFIRPEFAFIRFLLLITIWICSSPEILKKYSSFTTKWRVRCFVMIQSFTTVLAFHFGYLFYFSIEEDSSCYYLSSPLDSTFISFLHQLTAYINPGITSGWETVGFGFDSWLIYSLLPFAIFSGFLLSMIALIAKSMLNKKGSTGILLPGIYLFFTYLVIFSSSNFSEFPTLSGIFLFAGTFLLFIIMQINIYQKRSAE